MKKHLNSYLPILFLGFLFLLTQTVKAQSPAETYRQFYAAVQNQDVAAMKLTFSKKTLQDIDAFAKRAKYPTDEVLQAVIKTYKKGSTETPEYKNQKITGKRATLLVKAANGKWSVYKFIKEDSDWKIVIEGLNKF